MAATPSVLFGGGCLFHEWWMIYGVNCSLSIYFSHWRKSVSQPRPTGSLRVGPGPRPLSLTQRHKVECLLAQVEHERASRSGCFSVATWSSCWIAVHGGSPCTVSMLALQVSVPKIYHVSILKTSRTKVSHAAMIKKKGEWKGDKQLWLIKTQLILKINKICLWTIRQPDTRFTVSSRIVAGSATRNSRIGSDQIITQWSANHPIISPIK